MVGEFVLALAPSSGLTRRMREGAQWGQAAPGAAWSHAQPEASAEGEHGEAGEDAP